MTAHGGQGQRVQTELGSKSLNASEQAAVAEFRWQEMHSHIPSMHWPPTWSLTCRKGRDRCPSPPYHPHNNTATMRRYNPTTLYLYPSQRLPQLRLVPPSVQCWTGVLPPPLRLDRKLHRLLPTSLYTMYTTLSSQA